MLLDEAAHLGRRQARRHLVDQQEPGPAGQRAGEFDRLALLQRQAVGAFVELVAEPGVGGEARGFGQRLRPRQAVSRRGTSAASRTFSCTVRSPNGRGI